jgi:predicted acylesterase/phospholipase RssA/CRP-like cAMP-binding protein
MTSPNSIERSLSSSLAAHGLAGAPRRSLAQSELLFSRGDRGTDAFWVLSGRLEVLAEDGSLITTLGPDELVGEYVALVGGERTATIRAAEPSEVAVVDAQQLEDLLRADPELASDVRSEAARRIQDTRLKQVLTALVPTGNPDVISAIGRRGSWRRLDAGDLLFEAGEQARSGFVVVSGRLRRVSAADQTRSTGYLAGGSIVGEEGLAGGVRKVTVEAVRDTVVLELSRDDFTDLLVEFPRDLAPVALGLAAGVAPPRRQLDRSIAIAVVGDVDARGVIDELATHIGHVGSLQHLSSERVDRVLDRPGISQAPEGDPAEIRLLEYVAQLERENCYLVLEADEQRSAWSQRTLRQADVLAIVATVQGVREQRARVDSLLQQAGPRTLRVLVLLHPAGTLRPQGTAELMSATSVDHVLHARAGSGADMARVARTLAGRPVGLVLGGGGARGFAGLGVYRAMHELGIPVDAVGATSIGAPLAAAIAQGVAPDEARDVAQRGFHNVLDYTLPLVSLLKGERTSAAIVEQFGQWQIEDLWLPYFCISTNLTQGRIQIHRSGDLATAVRASTAIPGAFPPVPFGEDLLVDGGVTNNLPVDVMRRLHPTAEIVAVEVAPTKGPRAKSDFGLSVSGWQAMKSTVGRGPSYPGLIAVLMRSMITGSMGHREMVVAEGMADLLLDLDMRGVGLMEFDRVVDVAAKGYEVAMPRLEAWLEQRRADGSPVPGAGEFLPGG